MIENNFTQEEKAVEENKKNFTIFLCLLFAMALCLRFFVCTGLPFLVGFFLASAAEPAVKRLQQRLKLPRGLCAAAAVTATLAILAVVVVLAAGFILGQIPKLTAALPELADMVGAWLEKAKIWLLNLAERLPPQYAKPLQERILSASLGSTSYVEQGVKYILSLAGTALWHIPGSAMGGFTAVISAYLICIRRPAWSSFFRDALPEKQRLRFNEFYVRMHGTLKSWLVCQAKLSGVTFCILVGGMLLLRLPHPLGWAAATAILDAMPVLGVGTVLLPWCLLCLMQGQGAAALGLLGLYFTAVFVRSALEPKLMGRHLGLDPLITLMALYIGFRLWGIAGMLLMPLAAVGAGAVLTPAKCNSVQLKERKI